MKSQKGIVAALLLLTIGCVAEAAIVHVPSDQPTITAGINFAADGDTVLVADGMYFENVQVRTKKIVLASHFILDGDVNHILNTIINGSTPVHSDTGSCVIVAGSATFGSVVRGFTLTGGTGTRWRDISDNKIYREGGGILIEADAVKIYDNIIANNTATITAGSASAGGGGIRIGFGSGEFVRNVIAHNQGRYGSGFVAFHASVQIKNNVVWDNTGSQSYGGAGLWIWGSGSSTAANNTIVFNSTTSSGGGISIRDQFVILVNNIVYGNTAASGAQIYAWPGSSVTISYCDVEGGYAGTGNIDQLPDFDATNFLLSQLSPCIDSGNPEVSYNDPEDPENPGFAYLPALGTIRSDMGAYGGLLAANLPLFTAPAIFMIESTVQFDSIGVGETDTSAIRLAKEGYGNVTIDSVVFVCHPPENLTALTALPHQWGPARTDSLLIAWKSLSAVDMLDTALVYHSDSSALSPLVVELRGKSCCMLCGDADGSGFVDIDDIVFLITFVFAGGPAPVPIEAGDADCSGGSVPIDIDDVVYLINYVFASGPEPCTDCT